MKSKIFIVSILMLILNSVSNIYAQISEGGQPYVFTHQISTSIEIKEMPIVDIEALLREDEFRTRR